MRRAEFPSTWNLLGSPVNAAAAVLFIYPVFAEGQVAPSMALLPPTRARRASAGNTDLGAPARDPAAGPARRSAAVGTGNVRPRGRGIPRYRRLCPDSSCSR